MPVLKKEKTRVLVTCAFCRGKGVDPFGIISRLSTCSVCNGEKAVWFERPVKDCVFCNGTGVSPTGGRNYCPVCGGAGTVHVEEPSLVCPECGGTGWNRSMSLYCNICKGTGVVPTEEAEKEALKAKLTEQRDTYQKRAERIDADLAKMEV